MSPSVQFLSPSEAARRLGVSAKALRLYEERGLVVPVRTAAGWRAYGPSEMARAAEVAALRTLGLSLAQVRRVLGGDAQDLEAALAGHQSDLEARARDLSLTLAKVAAVRADLARGRAPSPADLAGLLAPGSGLQVAFDLPWPWGGERFEMGDIRALNYVIGPLGSGKTRLIRQLAETLRGAVFVGPERLEDGHAPRRMDQDAALKLRVEAALAWLTDEGASASPALTALLAELEAAEPAVLVIDMMEQGLDEASQEALVAYLRRRGPGARPIFATTRSSSILDLAAVGADETITLCPANHSPPMRVAAHPGSPGYEAVATCLASPDVRARTAGMTVKWAEVA